MLISSVEPRFGSSTREDLWRLSPDRIRTVVTRDDAHPENVDPAYRSDNREVALTPQLVSNSPRKAKAPFSSSRRDDKIMSQPSQDTFVHYQSPSTSSSGVNAPAQQPPKLPDGDLFSQISEKLGGRISPDGVRDYDAYSNTHHKNILKGFNEERQRNGKTPLSKKDQSSISSQLSAGKRTFTVKW